MGRGPFCVGDGMGRMRPAGSIYCGCEVLLPEAFRCRHELPKLLLPELPNR